MASTNTYIETASGRKLDFANPIIQSITLDDIAIGLSKTSRFAGQYKGTRYSVLNHSMLVYDILTVREQPEYLLEGLLHDAHEAYTGDVPTPLKKLCPDYQKIEERLDKVIRMKYHLPPQMSQAVKDADRLALYIESKDIKYSDAPNWENYKSYDYPEVKKELERMSKMWGPQGTKRFKDEGTFKDLVTGEL